MINIDLKEALNQKLQDGDFTAADLADFFGIFCQLGNEIEDLQEEVEDWNCRIQFNLEGAGQYWISVEDGVFINGDGEIEDAKLTLTMAADAAAQVFSGEKDGEAVLNAGILKIVGDLPDAMKFAELLELVLEEIEY